MTGVPATGICRTTKPEPFNCGGYTNIYVPGFPGDGLTFLNKGQGGFDPYLWDYTDPNGFGSATLNVTVGLDI